MDNRNRLTENLPEKARRCLFRFKLDDKGCIVGDIDETNLYDAIRTSHVLEPFTKIPDPFQDHEVTVDHQTVLDEQATECL